MKASLFSLRFTGELPGELESVVDSLTELAMDLRWTWSHGGDELWATISPETWEQTENPFVILQNLTRPRLEELNASHVFRDQLQGLVTSLEEYRAAVSWYDEAGKADAVKGIAYFSMEFGLGEALPLYAGGLGVLAGDYLKAASDLGLPLVGVGLLFQEGYFRQVLDADGWQQEIYAYNDSTSMPIRPVLGAHGGWLQIPIEFPGRTVYLRVWEARVGRIALYLLDSNAPQNSAVDQGITGKLYGGGQEMRLVQEIALGIGGWRLIEALELQVDICHLNEGHAAFVTLERARCFMERSGVNFWEALWATRAGNVFTTHTPVAAGFDTFHPDMLAKYGRAFAESLGVAPRELLTLGRTDTGDGEPFNMAYLAARTCATVNGVSRLHGRVSRGIFADLYPRWPQKQVPVTHVTNGIHVPSWDSPWADALWTRACGKGRWRGSEEALSEAVASLDDETLWSLRGRERNDFIHRARRRLARLLGQRGGDAATVAMVEQVLDPNALTLGFARRFAEYKRPNLLLHDPERLVRLLTQPERPAQIIVAGKAHPQDEQGKRFIQQWARFVGRPEVRQHAVFLEDYDIGLAQEMVQGVDVWINNPRRPWEASGTSGMKVLVNGGMNLSELDGWWAEAFTPEVGWSLGDGREHGHDPGWDAEEAEQLYRLLEDQVAPLFYQRDAGGVPRAWLARMRQSMARLTPRFSTNRMVREYVEDLYTPAAAALHQRRADGARGALELARWERHLRDHWAGVHFGGADVRKGAEGWEFSVAVYLGEIGPEAVSVQLYAEAAGGDGEPFCQPLERGDPISGAVNGYVYHGGAPADRGAHEYTPRVVPHHPQAWIPNELALITWQH